ncbi:hypothetical protein [Paenibacillus sp.]|uniref:hypothetical protein n=1 Tax=Paenibacillus sp. TaxID=58172 RepID=UPI0028119C7F|nr:hypothetical protein [Paenibacillus sp.]
MAFEEKVLLLRRYEQRVYSICLHLVGEEPLASEAAEAALVALFGDPAFAAGSEGERSRSARAAAVRHALLLHSKERGFAHARAHG